MNEWVLSMAIVAVMGGVGYLFGSISSAIIVCKLLGHPDPRSTGSQNPGATNVLRIAGKPAALLTLLGDVLKGVIPLLLLELMADSPSVLAKSAIGLGAVLGHLYPLFFKFQGGKGVATALGVVHIWHPLLGLALDAIWLVTALISRYSSLASMVSWALAPIVAYLLGSPFWPYLIPMALLILSRHKENGRRLLQGEESKLGEKGQKK